MDLIFDDVVPMDDVCVGVGNDEERPVLACC